jgi:hypothetical protein
MCEWVYSVVFPEPDFTCCISSEIFFWSEFQSDVLSRQSRLDERGLSRGVSIVELLLYEFHAGLLVLSIFVSRPFGVGLISVLVDVPSGNHVLPNRTS